MSETCIVCLGDLGENASALPVSGEQLVQDVDAKLINEAAGDAIFQAASSPPPPPQSLVRLAKSASSSETEMIAHLLPCGHYLHDECLKPWVERANSCPICRQTFNQVELMKDMGGTVISSYPVQDRTQVPDIDLSILFEDDYDAESSPCQECGSEDNEDILLICDGCSAPYHTYCIGLDGVPTDDWYCESCAIQQAVNASLGLHAPGPPRYRRRTRAEARRNRNNALVRDSDWARVWESVFDRTTLDLDFPYYNEDSHSFRPARSHQSRGVSAWEQRLRVAEEQGGARQLRNIAPRFDFNEAPASRPRPEPEEPESLEEIMAWNAMEKARDIEADPSGRSRKRRRTRSLTASPASPRQPPDPAPRKRPRMRRPNEVHEVNSDGGESSGSRLQRLNRSLQSNNNNGPSFLQSLLKEVETSNPEEDEARGRPRLSLRAASGGASPQGSSPEASPTNSNAPSPRAGSASPAPSTIRPGSPQLTSHIEAAYPQLGPEDMLPPSQRQSSPERAKLKPKSRLDTANRTRSWVEATDSSPSKAGAELSPTRASMSLSTKEKIQKLVKDALKEPYQANKIDKDQYTDINRNVSRMLYEKVGEDGDVDGSQSTEWRRMATDEVGKAVVALQISEG